MTKNFNRPNVFAVIIDDPDNLRVVDCGHPFSQSDVLVDVFQVKGNSFVPVLAKAAEEALDQYRQYGADKLRAEYYVAVPSIEPESPDQAIAMIKNIFERGGIGDMP